MFVSGDVVKSLCLMMRSNVLCMQLVSEMGLKFCICVVSLLCFGMGMMWA